MLNFCIITMNFYTVSSTQEFYKSTKVCFVLSAKVKKYIFNCSNNNYGVIPANLG